MNVESIFNDFPSLFKIKRDAIDKYPLWRDKQNTVYYIHLGQEIYDQVVAWRKMAEPYLRSCENKAREYDKLMIVPSKQSLSTEDTKVNKSVNHGVTENDTNDTENVGAPLPSNPTPTEEENAFQ